MILPAGYSEEFRCDFRTMSIRDTVPQPALDYRLSLYRRGYAGDYTELRAGGNPYEYSTTNSELIGLDPRRANFEVVSDESIELVSFYADDDRSMLVVVYYGDSYENIDFVGWLTPYQAEQPYQGGKFLISLQATCGLASLKDFEYSYPLGYNTIHDVLYNCLLKLGYELPVWIASQVYEDGHKVAGQMPEVNLNALKASRWNTQSFYKNGQRINCYTILTTFCESNYILRQDGGVWKILRVEHLLDFSAQVSWLIYENAADETPTVFTEDLRKNVYRGNAVKPLRGSKEGIEPAIRHLELTVQYGDLVNRLRNGSFGSGLSNWTINPAFSPVPTVVGDGIDVAYAVRILGNAGLTGPNATPKPHALLQNVSLSRSVTEIRGSVRLPVYPKINNQRHIVTLSGIYANYNCAGPAFQLKVVCSSGTYYLKTDGQWSNSSKDDLTLYFRNTYTGQGNTELARPTSGEQFTISSADPVPGLGDYTLTVILLAGLPFSPTDQRVDAAIELQQVMLTIEDTNKFVATKEIINVRSGDVNPIIRPKKETVTLNLCDQTSYFGGASVRDNALLHIDTTPTKRWSILTVSGLMRDKWQNLTAIGRLRLRGSLGRVFEGEVIGDITPFTLLQFPELDSKLFIITQYRRNSRTRITSVRAVERLQVDFSVIQITASYETSDGVRTPMTGEASFSADETIVTLPTGMLSAVQRSVKKLQVQGFISPSNANPGSTLAGYIVNDSGTIVQTEPPLWLELLSQSL